MLLFAFFGLFAWVVFGAMPRGDSYEEARARARAEKFKVASEEADKALQGYGWVDKEKGSVHLPIARAMELSAAELAQRKPAPANAIPPADAAAAGLQVTAPVTPPAAPIPSPAAAAAVAPKAGAITGKDSENRGQPAAASNPPDSQPGSQPGPAATAAASPPAPASKAQPGAGAPTATPVQTPVGTPIPVRPTP